MYYFWKDINKKIKENIVYSTTMTGIMMSLVLLITFGSGVWFGLKFNLGDAIIICISILLPLKVSIPAAGIGSMLADLAAGYATYMPATLIIKSIMAFLCSRQLWKYLPVIGILIGEGIMMAGYYFTDWIIYGESLAYLNLFWNAIQLAAAVGVGYVFLISIIKYERVLKARVK